MIKIEDLIPLLKEGWVAMDEDGCWNWFSHKPQVRIRRKLWNISIGVGTDFCPLHCFGIDPVEDWTKSLIKIERKDKCGNGK